MPVSPHNHYRQSKTGKPKPVDPAAWLERTESLVDRYRSRENAAVSSRADPGLGYIWIAADYIFESKGHEADFAFLDVPALIEDCASLMNGKTAHFVAALAAFYAFLAEAQLIDLRRAAAIQAELANVLPGPSTVPRR
jgi:hypothetical protein